MFLDKMLGIKTVYMDVEPMAELIDRCFIQGAEKEQLDQVRATIKGKFFLIQQYTKGDYQLRVSEYKIRYFPFNLRTVWVYDQKNDTFYELRHRRWYKKIRKAVYERLDCAVSGKRNLFCPQCGVVISVGSDFCSNCGGKLSNGKTVVSQQAETQKKSVWKKIGVIILIVVFAIIVLFGILVLCTPDQEQRIKEGSMIYYDYGETLDESLKDWFGGEVTWDSFEEEGKEYVTASGVCPYMADVYNSDQTFVFQIVDDSHFEFVGAYDSDGYEIFTNGTDDLMGAYLRLLDSCGEENFYNLAIKAAFGDQESLNMFKDMQN